MNEKRVFITGGASGLGRALAERYARAGARVCIGDLNDERGAETLAALQAYGHDAHYLHCDVTQEADLEAAAQWMQAHWGGADVIVNNAGVAASGAIDELSLTDWQWIVDINLLGVVRGCKAFAPMLKAQHSGHIVNVASMAGLIHPPLMSAYNATKASVVALSETLKVELAKNRVNVSVVCPAFFRTNLTETARAGDADSSRMMNKLVTKARRGADEIADLVYAGIERGDFHILTHKREARIWRLKRALPYPVFYRLMLSATRKMMGKAAQRAAGDA
ncbi:SDR family oxidoreductase [Solimonas marina]|uniref:SDR family oxidoreductase n=1 Tax=Solimonas marina TaxID=2714601 RepID=A0A969WCC4_9GAMM|nr:SDR family oxidoreductase [Solimonas marina]NKF23939.1 SDR family oxidoreductase [Solimonas marina]